MKVKVICLDNTNMTRSLTLGKIYDAILQDGENALFKITISDGGIEGIYCSQHRFITVEEHRERILNDLLNESDL